MLTYIGSCPHPVAIHINIIQLLGAGPNSYRWLVGQKKNPAKSLYNICPSSLLSPSKYYRLGGSCLGFWSQEEGAIEIGTSKARRNCKGKPYVMAHC